MKALITVVCAFSLVALPGVALAQTQLVSPQQPPAPKSTTPAREKMVCEKQEVVGSRLSTRRVCMTLSQWQDAQGQDRALIEKVQTQRGIAGNP